MVKVTFVEPDGNRRVVDAVPGDSLMTTATANSVEGIVGECGGGMSCGTCHLFADPGIVGAPGEDEGWLLETTATPATGRSRLGCQVLVTERLDGLVVDVPERQY